MPVHHKGRVTSSMIGTDRKEKTDISFIIVLSRLTYPSAQDGQTGRDCRA